MSLQISSPGARSVEANIFPTLVNGWVNNGSGYQTMRYYKTPEGIVHIEGCVNTGTLDIACFTLPVGYRPTGYVNIVSMAVSGVVTMFEVSGGSVSPRLAKPLSICASFRADA